MMIATKPVKKNKHSSTANEPSYLPTPEQIARECWLIRATWSEAETIRRRAAFPTDLDS